MIFTGTVLVSADGELLGRGTLQMVAPRKTGTAVVAEAPVSQGAFSVDAEPGAVWGLLIDGKPVVAIVASSNGVTADLGDILLVPGGVAWPAFHAPDGRIFGAPPAARAESSAATAPRPAAEEVPRVATRSSLTFGALLGSSAQQLGSAITSAKGLQLSGANITIKGVPVATDDALSIEFPNAELAASGVGLSEVSFTLKPSGEGSPPAPQPTGPALPDLLGYTRELALRKLTALGLSSEIRSEIVTDRARNGRIVRQVPRPGDPVNATTFVQIYVGKFAE